MKILPALALLLVFVTTALPAQSPETSNQQDVGTSTLPDPLVFSDGRAVETAEQWPPRRAEILELFEREVYGEAPPATEITWQVLAEDEVFGGTAIRRQVRLFLLGAVTGPKLDLLVYVPNNASAPVPAFLGLNFLGNHSVDSDPVIPLSQQWLDDRTARGTTSELPPEAELRGARAQRWPAELIVGRGYGLVTGYYGDIDPDYDDGFENGVHGHFLEPGQKKPHPHQWGSISAWAWGLSRALDYLALLPEIDGSKVAVIGHSRLGKTALWAGARDPRFAITISNDSGCGGAALSRRRKGETLLAINNQFPHWFNDNFVAYNEMEETLPIDQHMLIALMAPRPVYVASASEDLWADPEGEFLAVLAADPVYRLLGTPGLGLKDGLSPSFPKPGESLGETIGYHLRTGRHDITPWDWSHFLDFADRHFG